MFGILLITLGSLLSESAESFGKLEVNKKEEGIFAMGIINMFLSFIFLLASLFFGQKFIIVMASLPTLVPRIFFEILQTHMTLLAVTKADRTTYSFFRVITIPLLLVVDLVLGYSIQPLQFAGIFVIISVIFISSYKNVLNKKGLWFILFTGVNAVITISLYKYDISHFNSVVGEQAIVTACILVYLFVLLFIKKEESVLSLLKLKFLIQSSGVGVGGLMATFAYSYAPASIILSASRALSMVWSTLAGWKFFGEKNFKKKIIVCLFLIIGVFLLAL